MFTSSVMYKDAKPVIVYVAGNNAEIMPDSELAKQNGVVFVVVNVRQGVLGFLSHSVLSGIFTQFRIKGTVIVT